MRLNVLRPDKVSKEVGCLKCEDGKHVFTVGFDKTGNYRLTATYSYDKGMLVDECVISALQAQPTAFPEFHPLLLLLIAFVALFMLRKKTAR
ncbi:hypothetical protein HY991_04930 [Candidatus Micrarchaeota archaeon]|nr:hypothetical protein [Candidatus Micrarchaeota archaeon]